MHTEGDLHLPRCRFHNGVRLTDAHIGTDLLLNQAVVYRDRRGRSITGDGMTVGQDLQAEMLESHGELSLRGATRRRLAQPARQQADQPVHPPRAERPPADRQPHALHDPGGRR